MTLERGRLAKVDQRVFAELDQGDGVQMVKVPVSDAVWSTWRRYCDAIGLSMGEGVARLIVAELETVVERDGTIAAQLADLIAEQANERVLRLDARQRHLDAQADGLRRKEERLRAWERTLRTPPQPAGADSAKVGRNERCPCGSGLKYKHCHGGPFHSEP